MPPTLAELPLTALQPSLSATLPLAVSTLREARPALLLRVQDLRVPQNRVPLLRLPRMRVPQLRVPQLRMPQRSQVQVPRLRLLLAETLGWELLEASQDQGAMLEAIQNQTPQMKVPMPRQRLLIPPRRRLSPQLRILLRAPLK